MTESNDSTEIRFGGPATYRIVVQGSLSADWSDRLAGLEITITKRGDAAPQTTLLGRIIDQGELNAVLDALYGLHLPIVRVETIDAPESES